MREDSAMVLSKLSVLGRSTYLEYSRASAYNTCSRCGWGSGVGLLFLSCISSLFFLPMCEGR